MSAPDTAMFMSVPGSIRAGRFAPRRLALAFIVLLMLCGAAFPAVKDFSADTLIAWMAGKAPTDFLLIDVRNPDELAGSAIIGNENCRPYNFSLNLGTLDSMLAQLPKKALIICYCRSSGRSDQATQKLDDNGFLAAYSLIVGFSTWKGPTLAASMVKPRAVDGRGVGHALQA
jgi:rhodanese-related sulfurtransferase